MINKITSLQLGNNLLIDLVAVNGKIKVQPILKLLNLGDQKPFDFNLCLDKNTETNAFEFGYGGKHSYNYIFFTEINGKSIAGSIEDGIEYLLEWIS